MNDALAPVPLQTAPAGTSGQERMALGPRVLEELIPMPEAGNSPPFREELTAQPKLLSGVRRAIELRVLKWGFEDLAEPVALCAQELLSNVHKHTPSPECVLTLQRQRDGVRIGVSDVSSVFPVVRRPSWTAESGRGMVVLASTADVWGVDRTPTGKEVWAELRAGSWQVRA